MSHWDNVLPSRFKLNSMEEAAVADWLETPRVQQLLENGGHFAIVFGPLTSIGFDIVASVRDQDGNILSLDVSD